MTKILLLMSLAVLSAILVSSTSNAEAASVDYFLKIDGVEGESTTAGHEKSIDVESWSWGETNQGTHTGGGGGGAGKVSMQDFHFVTKINKASPVLMQACATGEHYKDAVLILSYDDGSREPREYLKITMSDVLVSSYQTGGSAGDIIAGESDADIIPIDQISLNFGKIEFEYTPQNDDGSDGEPVKGEASKPGRRA